jgi:hypothetical protein
MLKTTLAWFDIFPKVLKTGEHRELAIRPRGLQARFPDGRAFKVRVIPMNETDTNDPDQAYPEYDVTAHDGGLRFSHRFGGEGRYTILVRPRDEEPPSNQSRKPASLETQRFYVYAAEEDLFRLRPWRGDAHVHTCRSDGREDPAVVAAAYRRGGFDFLAITDHRQYEPSLEAIAAYRDARTDLTIFPGEEVHPPADSTHYIHFGGDSSVNAIFRNEPGRYEREIAEIAKTLDLPPGINPLKYASVLWVCAEIKKAGGLSIMVHPHWICNDSYNVREQICVYMLKNAPFDAFELTGGMTLQENQMQTALWQQLRAEGRTVPIVGSSDSHGSEVADAWFGISSMMVLAERCDRAGVFDAIRQRRVVVMEQYTGENFPRLYGEYRYVAFALFLLEEYFPLHDELCVEEGRLMKEYATGDKAAADRLASLSGRCAALMRRYWGV